MGRRARGRRQLASSAPASSPPLTCPCRSLCTSPPSAAMPRTRRLDSRRGSTSVSRLRATPAEEGQGRVKGSGHTAARPGGDRRRQQPCPLLPPVCRQTRTLVLHARLARLACRRQLRGQARQLERRQARTVARHLLLPLPLESRHAGRRRLLLLIGRSVARVVGAGCCLLLLLLGLERCRRCCGICARSAACTLGGAAACHGCEWSCGRWGDEGERRSSGSGGEGRTGPMRAALRCAEGSWQSCPRNVGCRSRRSALTAAGEEGPASSTHGSRSLC